MKRAWCAHPNSLALALETHMCIIPEPLGGLSPSTHHITHCALAVKVGRYQSQAKTVRRRQKLHRIIARLASRRASTSNLCGAMNHQ